MQHFFMLLLGVGSLLLIILGIWLFSQRLKKLQREEAQRLQRHNFFDP